MSEIVAITEKLPELRAEEFAQVRAWDAARMQLAEGFERSDGAYLANIQSVLAPRGRWQEYLDARDLPRQTAQDRILKAQGNFKSYQRATDTVAPPLLPAAEDWRVLDAVMERPARTAQRQAEFAERIAAPLPTGRHRCIVIDPPWPMQKIVRDRYPRQDAELDYAVMSLEEIEQLPIADLADADGCHLYVWTTHKFLPDALRLIPTWGFHYECQLTWMKPSGFTPFSWMYNGEHCLFARRGNLPLLRQGLKQAFEAPQTGHSRKPDHFYSLVREASPEPRLELFAREARDGFIGWGDEYGGDEESSA